MTNYIRFKQLQKLVPVSRVTISNWVRDGVFPPPYRLNPASQASPICWAEDEILAYLASRPRDFGLIRPALLEGQRQSDARRLRALQGKDWRGPTFPSGYMRRSPFPWERNGHDNT
jgi:predicted DNA-binding transcriptional regulator AlpA